MESLTPAAPMTHLVNLGVRRPLFQMAPTYRARGNMGFALPHVQELISFQRTVSLDPPGQMVAELVHVALEEL